MSARLSHFLGTVHNPSNSEKGFTLVELVLVMVVVAIVAVVVVLEPQDMTGTRASALARKLQSDIVYAQGLAMTRNLRHRVYFNTAPGPASGYVVVNNADGDATWGEAGEVAQDPAAANTDLRVTLNAGNYTGITLTGVGFAGGYVEFSALGVPFDADGALLGPKSITVGGTNPPMTVTVQKQTGWVSSP